MTTIPCPLCAEREQVVQVLDCVHVQERQEGTAWWVTLEFQCPRCAGYFKQEAPPIQTFHPRDRRVAGLTLRPTGGA